MRHEEPVKEIVTVTEMACLCRLSRARFYQLTGEGIFPTPSRNEQTGRPFFNREQQERCLLVRRTNRGANGKAVMFYGCRPEAPLQPKRKRKQLPISKPRHKPDSVITELRQGLAQLATPIMQAFQSKNAPAVYPSCLVWTRLISSSSVRHYKGNRLQSWTH